MPKYNLQKTSRRSFPVSLCVESWRAVVSTVMCWLCDSDYFHFIFFLSTSLPLEYVHLASSQLGSRCGISLVLFGTIAEDFRHGGTVERVSDWLDLLGL